jgi:hypothetical protein
MIFVCFTLRIIIMVIGFANCPSPQRSPLKSFRMMNPTPQHLQNSDGPTMNWEEWYVELCNLYAKARKIELSAARREVNVSEAQEWFEQGFTPFVTFRENF